MAMDQQDVIVMSIKHNDLTVILSQSLSEIKREKSDIMGKNFTMVRKLSITPAIMKLQKM